MEKWIDGNYIDKKHHGDRRALPYIIPDGKWTYHTIIVQGRVFNFFRNEKTGFVKAPGLVEFKSDSTERAEEVLYSAYYDPNLNF